MITADTNIIIDFGIILQPPGVMHWHGATAASSFAHLAANTNPEKTGLVWGGRLYESEYEKLPQN